jgi:NAD(P)-dependent dehydrogenase (short-subunit alcohol dehydrogenase family)
MSPQYWLVTGSNRGIGLAIVEQLAKRKDVVLFAGVRDTSNLGELHNIVAKNSNVSVVQLRLDVIEDAKDAASEIAKVTDHLDVVIANAGIAYNWDRLEKVDPEVAREHFTVNTLGTLVLFQAVLPLLRQSKDKPKFVPITTDLASMTKPASLNVSAVGLSKVGINYLVRRIVVEHASEGIIAFPVNPGGVKTAIGAIAAPALLGIEEFPMEPEESAAGILAVIDEATEESNGRFYGYDGQEIAW